MFNFIKNNLRKLGVDIVKYDLRRNSSSCVVSLLERGQIDFVLDIGANSGQYGNELRAEGYTGKIISFEPLGAAHEKLTQSAESDPNWQVFERCAVGSEEGTTSINVSNNSVSSSILSMEDAHLEAAPGSGYVGTEEVAVVTLNRVLKEVNPQMKPCHLKIDTQGYERFVVDGAREVLKMVSSIEMELSLGPMYQGGWLSHQAFVEMAELGFRPFTVFPFFQDHSTGETFQMDVIFVRAD